MRQELTAKAIILPWIIVGVAASFYCYEYFLRISPSVMTFSLMANFGVAAGALGNITAFYYYAYAPLQIPVGMLMDRFGPRLLLTIACLICAIGSYVFAMSNIFNIAALGRFIVGAGSAFAFVGVLKLATLWLPENRFAMVAGLTSALGTIGAMNGDIGLAVLVEHIGWRETIVLSAIVGLLLAVVIFIFVRDHNPYAEHKPSDDESMKTGDLLKTTLKILENPQMWILGLIGCLLYLPTSMFAELWGIPYLRSVYHLSDGQASFINSFIFLGFTLGAPVAGFISDRIKRRRLPMIIGGLSAAFFSCIFIYVPNLSYSALLAVMFLLGVSYGTQAIVFAIGRELNSKAFSGTAIAITNMFVMLGGVFFQPIIGFLLDLGWDGKVVRNIHVFSEATYRHALSVLPLGLLLGVVLIFYLKETGPFINNNND